MLIFKLQTWCKTNIFATLFSSFLQILHPFPAITSSHHTSHVTSHCWLMSRRSVTYSDAVSLWPDPKQSPSLQNVNTEDTYLSLPGPHPGTWPAPPWRPWRASCGRWWPAGAAGPAGAGAGASWLWWCCDHPGPSSARYCSCCPGLELTGAMLPWRHEISTHYRYL